MDTPIDVPWRSHETSPIPRGQSARIRAGDARVNADITPVG